MQNCVMVSWVISLLVQSRHKIACISDLVKMRQQRYPVIFWPIRIFISHKNPFTALIVSSLVLPREIERDTEVVIDAQLLWF